MNLQHPDIIKAAVGGAFAVTSWAAGQLAQAIDTIPTWVKSADTPLVIIGLGYGVIHLWKELQKSQTNRIADRDSFISLLTSESAKASESRERLIRVTEQQTSEFKALRREVTRNGGFHPQHGIEEG
jgi:hypothetical protein